MTNLSDLIERVEAGERSRALDWEIHLHDGLDGKGAYGMHPHYLTSIDAAMTLVDEGMQVEVLLEAIDNNRAVVDWLKHLPRHIVAAALKARALQEKDIEHG